MVKPDGDQGRGSSTAPVCYAIPGNHDWYDGLNNFIRHILHREWLGGWRLPQNSSYFSLKLPRGWWVLGCDTSLTDDIDIEQYRYFAHIARTAMAPGDRAILLTHAPDWTLLNHSSVLAGRDPLAGPLDRDRHMGQLLHQLLHTDLAGKLAMRLAGDVHHYTRHSPCGNGLREGPQLVVSGGGGAFLHPTHCFHPRIVGNNGKPNP